ncbi:MAG: tetratricopeptide repeat protein, partial [Cyclobacteriaceae bacterium]
IADARRIFENLTDSTMHQFPVSQKAELYYYLGELAHMSGKHADAVAYFEKAYALNTKGSHEIIGALSQAGMGKSNNSLENYTLAERQLKAAIKTFEKNDYQNDLSEYYFALGQAAQKQGKLTDAGNHFKKAITLADRTGSTQIASLAESNLDMLSERIFDLQESKINVEKASLDNQIGEFKPSEKLEAYRQLALRYAEIESYENAWLTMNRYAELADSLYANTLDEERSESYDLVKSINTASESKLTAKQEPESSKGTNKTLVVIIIILAGALAYLFFLYKKSLTPNATENTTEI